MCSSDLDYTTIVECVLGYFADANETFRHRTRPGQDIGGALRHLVVRSGAHTREVLVNLVTTSHLQADLGALVDKMAALTLEGQLKGFLHTTHDGVADTTYGERTELLWGRGCINEQCCGLNYTIHPYSFFQTNTLGAELLYAKAREYAGDIDVLYDLYCGTGAIGQSLSVDVSPSLVLGVDVSMESIQDANANAVANNLDHCRYIASDALDVESWMKGQPRADVIVVDPPRDGLHPKALRKFADIGAPTIVYISCKPSSLARDLAALAQHGYAARRICAVDMFPRTSHVECVALLEKE